MQTQLRWNRMDEHYAMELDWSRLELVRILGKIKRPFNFIRNKSLKRNLNQGENFSLNRISFDFILNS